MGLLDQFANLNPEQTQGLLAAASQILQQSGDPRRPFGIGQAMGAGIEAYQGSTEAARQRKLQEAQQAQMAQMRGLQMQDMQGGLDDRARTRAQEQSIANAARGAFRTPEQMASSLPGGPTNANAAQIPNMKPGFDQDSFIDQVMQIDPMRGLALRQQFAKQAPQIERVEVAMRDGVPVRVMTFKDGTERVSAFDPKADMVEQNIGGSIQWVDRNRVQNGQSVKRTLSPDSAASNALGWANYGLSKERVGIEREAAANKAKNEKAPTEFQGKSAAYGLRATEADKILSDIGGKYSPAAINSKQYMQDLPLVGGAAGALSNLSLSDNDQKAEQAQRDFVNAVLRQESGAAIAQPEFLNAKRQYFPQPGDSDAVIKQKSRNRSLAIQGLQTNAGRAAMTAAPAPVESGVPTDIIDLMNKYGGD
jgi:hypothetical protein